MNCKLTLLSHALITVALFCFLQSYLLFHFYYVEQGQLFLWTYEYWIQRISIIGGFSLWLSEFCVQFFAYFYWGAAILALLLSGIAYGCGVFFCRLTKCEFLGMLGWLPVMGLLFMQWDVNYRFQGIIAAALMLFILNLYSYFSSSKLRIAIGMIGVFLLYGLAGSVAFLFVCLAFLYECHVKPGNWLFGFILLLIGTCIGIYLVYSLRVASWSEAFSPALYYRSGLALRNVNYLFSELIIVVSGLLILFSSLFKKLCERKWGVIAIYFLPILILGCLLRYGYSKYYHSNTMKYEELDYYSRHGAWDQLISRSNEVMNNYTYQCLLNRALAEKGELTERLFSTTPQGIDNIIVLWNRSENISILLSDIYYTTGSIALSQRMAFEANVCALGEGNPRMLQRLVETNLILGAFPVALKYIRLLEDTYVYKNWAIDHRKYLYNDSLIMADKELGGKRKLLVRNNHLLAQVNGFPGDLWSIVKEHPKDAIAAASYLGGMLLLAKDLKGFRQFIEFYIVEGNHFKLPQIYQEAIVAMSESNPKIWAQYHIDESIIERFYKYKKQVLAYKDRVGNLNNIRSSFGDTYWYYLMYK